MKHLTSEQRYTIEVMYAQGDTQKHIAEAIGKRPSTISRELKRNSDRRNGAYKSSLAQRKYGKRMRRKPKRVYFTPPMQQYVAQQLALKYSPEQIVGAAKRYGVACVSHERIYQYIWADKKRGGTHYIHLRTQGKRYRKRGSMKDKRGLIPHRVSIAKRPAIVEERARFADMEIDTIIGKNHKGAILTINDRATGWLKMKRWSGKNAEPLADAAIELLGAHKGRLKTITADNGKEFAEHEKIAKSLAVDFYFAHPYRSWERGSNENLNGLIRQYIPKKTDFSTLSDEYIQGVEDRLNRRPRKRFNFETPNQRFKKLYSSEIASMS